jgi:orotate phosphoribosyltransferase
MNLFRLGDFILHSGQKGQFKIDCDALTELDIKTLACIISKEFRFSKVVGIPTGGTRLAEACEVWTKEYGPLLIVDDVLTTGASMEEEKDKHQYLHVIGVVVFARGPCPTWIHPLFDMGRWFNYYEDEIA